MDWFRKRKEAARLARFFGKLKKKQDMQQEVAKPPPALRVVDFQGCQAMVLMNTFAPRITDYGPFYNGASFANYLCKKKGYKELGAGAHSIVVAKEGSDKVIKIGNRPHDRWIEYCKWAAENGFAGGFAPQVYSYKYIKGKSSDFTLAVMERMDKSFVSVDRTSDMFAFNQLADSSVAYKNPTARTLSDLLVPGSGKFLGAYLDKFPTNSDLGLANMMFRKDGSVCFTDPIAGWVTPCKERIRAKDFTTKTISFGQVMPAKKYSGASCQI